MRVEIKDDEGNRTLSIDFDAKAVYIGSRKVWLSAADYRLINVLGLCAGTMVSKKFVAMFLYHTLEPAAFTNVRSAACRLRKKLSDASGGRNYIVDVERAGYMLA
ncbi:MAG TPA: winged helix-turn-helix domain-containing protein [Candidatus Paceibacterota bacterium]|nr:winged helix-turn-helix domain-containing protein [Candidatus Paceibacterota bacterium]